MISAAFQNLSRSLSVGFQKCSGSNCLAAIRRLVPDETVRSKLLYQNASRLLKINLA